FDHHHHHHHHPHLSPSLARVGIRIATLQSFLSLSNSSDNPVSFISLFTTWSHVCSGLPLPSFSPLPLLQTLETTSSSCFLTTWPYHRSLFCASASLTLFSPIITTLITDITRTVHMIIKFITH